MSNTHSSDYLDPFVEESVNNIWNKHLPFYWMDAIYTLGAGQMLFH